MRCCLSAPLAALAAFPAPGDLVRSGALLTPAVLRSALAARRERITRADVVTALNLELVTLTEDSAVITWYTAVPGTDDGFGHLIPAVTEGEVVYGTHPGPPRPHGVGGPADRAPLRRADGPGAGPDVLLPGPFARPGGHTDAAAPGARQRGGHLAARPGLARRPLLLHDPPAAARPPPPVHRALQRPAPRRDHGGPGGRRADAARGLAAARSRPVSGDHEPGDGRGGPPARGGRPAGGRGHLGGRRTPGPGRGPPHPGRFRHPRTGLLRRTGQPRPPQAPGRLLPRRIPGRRRRPRLLRPRPGRPASDRAGHLREDRQRRGRGRAERGATGLASGRLEARPGPADRRLRPSPAHHTGLGLPHGRGVSAWTAARPARSSTPTPPPPASSSTTRATPTATSARSWPCAPHVTQQEVSAVKDYPGGFCLLRVHTGGYALNYYKNSSVPARAWVERSRLTAGGLWPHHALGRSVTDRNSMRPHDLSGVRAYLRG